MKIGVLGPFNPVSIADFLPGEQLPSINVAATAVNTLVHEFLSMGHQVYVFTLSYATPQKYRIIKGNNVEVHLIPTGLIPWLLGSHQMVFGPFVLSKRIAKIVKGKIKDIDVIHAHWTYEYAKAASYLSKEIPVFDTVRDWCPYQLSLMKGRNNIDWEIKNILFKQVMADKRITFIANSTYTERMITQACPHIKPPIIPNPIDKTWILDKKRKDVKHQVVSIAAGLCSRRKNIGKLIEAFVEYNKIYPDARLHLVGSYDETFANYVEWKKNGWLENVIFYGILPHNQLVSILDEMSIMVHPAWEETFGNIFLEAISRCVPCIGGEKSGAVPEVLGYGSYGLLCDIHDAQCILNSMLKMEDQSIYNMIQKSASKMIKEKYSSDVIAQRHIDLFTNVIRK